MTAGRALPERLLMALLLLWLGAERGCGSRSVPRA
ncbi:hypothetical protein RKD30_006866 [Streptomyces pristinaespiralis]